jgi:hypothetical protein
MSRRNTTLFFILFLAIFLSLACSSPLMRPAIEPTPRTFIFQGKGVHTWAWNNGEQTCDTEDDMVLTIDAGTVTLRSDGKCMYIQGLNPYTCYELHPGDRCGITLTGNYNGPNSIIFKSCSNGQPTTGTATDQNGTVSGTARCGAESFNFSLPMVK